MATKYVMTTGNDTTGDGSSGNPYASPGKAAGIATTNGDIIYVKSGTYTLTSSTQNVAGGKVVLASGVRMEGYASTIGDLGTAPVISAGAITSIRVVEYSNGLFTAMGGTVVNIKVDGNSGSGVTGFYDNSDYGASIHRCTAINCPSVGFDHIRLVASRCYADTCGTGFVLNGATGGVTGIAVGCYAKSCTLGFSGCVFALCIAHGGTDGFNDGLSGSHTNCVAYGCSGDGFKTTYNYLSLVNCLAVSCGGYGVSSHSAGMVATISVATYNNTSGAIRYAIGTSYGNVTLSGDPFTNAAGGDFSLNNTAGAGAACRAAGFPGAFLGASTTGYLDIGAVQHADPAAGGGGTAGLLSTGFSGVRAANY